MSWSRRSLRPASDRARRRGHLPLALRSRRHRTPVRELDASPRRFCLTHPRDASARRFFSYVHRLSPPSCEPHHVLERRHRVLVAVGGEHAPPHIVARRQRQERWASVPVACPKAPGEADEVEREPRAQEAPQGEARRERRPAGGGAHAGEFTREACPGRFPFGILTAYDARQRSRRRRIPRASRPRPLSARVPDLSGDGVLEHLLARRARRARRRIAQFVDVWQARGAAAWYDVWWAALGELRARYARIVGASPEEIALAPSISVALSAVAEALDYRRRPRVVVTSLDFPTVAYQWLAKRARGVELVVVESPDQVSVPVEAIARAVDDRTALVATSHVYFTSGAIQDIQRVADVARARGALTLVDAYQSVGQVPVDVKAAGVDFLTAGGLKWLLGGPGIVLLYVRDELARRLAPAIAGWFGHKDQFAFDPRALELHDDARRFELGTPALAAVYAQLGGLDYIDEIGVPAIRRVTSALTEDLVARARDYGFRPKVASRAEDRSAIVMLPAADPAAGVRHLAAGGIIADARPGHVRLSPFFYNVQDDHVSALERLARHTSH